MKTNSKIAIDAARVREFAAAGCNIGQVAHNLGISRDTLDRRRKDDPAVAEALEEGHAAAVSRVENTLYEMAVSGKCVAATIFYLKCQAPDVWNDKQAIDITSRGSPVQIQIIDDLKELDAESADA